MVDEIQQLRVDIAQLRLENNQQWQAYERRHGELVARVAQMETRVMAFATREDVIALKESINNFKSALDGSAKLLQESLLRFETTAESMATRTDVDWLKRAFWAGVGLLTAIGGGLALHILQGGLRP